MNRARFSILFTSALLAASLAGVSPDATACAVLTPDQSVPVTGHQMILSLSKDKTTLWDQFTFTGAPESFGWILPTKGTVDIGISSPILFSSLGQLTAPIITAPDVCPNSCDGKGNSGGGSGGLGGDRGVHVIAEEVIGDYQTVQLSSSDPASLTTWLKDNGYPIPATILPVLDAYVTEGFDFVAIKLLPGKGLDSIKPVRVSMTGAAPSVPMRLLQAGTGDLTQVTLFIVSDGKYLPTKAPVVTIGDADLTWDFAANTSDYDAVRKQKLAASGGLAYLVEHAATFYADNLNTPLTEYVMNDPVGSAYGKDAAEASKNLQADLDALIGALGSQPFVTRLSGDLTRDALKEDLPLQAAADQSTVNGDYYPTKHVNDDACPPDPCEGEGGSGASGGGQTVKSGGCGVPASTPGDGAALGLVLALGLTLLRARRARK